MGNRSVQPFMPAQNYKTYFIAAPLKTHWRQASCEEANCEQFKGGWFIPLDERTQMGQKHAYTIRRLAGRQFTEYKDSAGVTIFTFPPGQQCFEKHMVRVDRPEIMGIKGGDFRGNPRGTQTRIHSKPEHWVEDFALHQDELSTEIERG